LFIAKYRLTLLKNKLMAWTEAWFRWIDYRKQIKKPYKSEMSKEAAMKWLCKYPEDIREQIIETSIRNGWQGLFEPKNYNNGGQQAGKTGTSQSRLDALKGW
jgi:hypothetical protein